MTIGPDKVRSYDDAYNALGTLCHEGIIGDKSYNINMPHLRHLVGEVGDKIKPETTQPKVNSCYCCRFDCIGHGHYSRPLLHLLLMPVVLRSMIS